MVWKGKLLLVVIWIAVTSAGSLVVMRMQPIYKAETLVLVESQKIPDKFVASTVIQDVQDRLATISQEILSTTRLKKIVEDYHLYSQDRTKHSFEEIVESMRHDVEVRLEKGWSNDRPGAFRIGYQGSDPTVVAAVANRLASLYIDENLRVREVQAEGTSQFIDAQLSEAKKTLDDLEAAVSRYKVAHNGELPQQESSISSALSRLQTELQGTQDSMSRAQQNIVMYDAEIGTIEPRLSALLAPRDVTHTEDVTQPRVLPERQPAEPAKASQALITQLAALRARYSDEHPEVKRVKAELAEVLRSEQQQAPEPVAHEGPATLSVPRPKPATRQVVISPEAAREVDQLQQRANALRAQRAIANNEIQTATSRRQEILREMATYQSQLKRLPIREQEMAGLTRDYETARANYRSLLDKKTSADMATDMERRQKAERFMVLDPAQVPEKPTKPNRPVLIAMSSVLGLALGIALAFAKEWNKDLLLGEWELPAGVPVLGRIPDIRLMLPSEPPRRRRMKRGALAATGSTLLCLMLFLFRQGGL